MYNNPQLMTKVGAVTPRVVIYKSESHKLHQAFPVKKGDNIVAGQPVKLNEDGTISPYFDTTGVYLGIATTNSETPAYNDNEVTVMCRGFAVIYGKSNGQIKAGLVTPDSIDDDDQYVKWNQGMDDDHFVALNTASGAGELIQILVK